MQKPRPKSATFYAAILNSMCESEIPFLIGGGYALKRHTGTGRPTRDLDLFVLPADAERVLQRFADQGYRTEMTFPHWLGKIYKEKAYVDVIFSSGNGVARVDDAWFEHAAEDEVLGHRVKLCPAEEMIWSKAFLMERERFDGADVLHLVRARQQEINWPRLLSRFGEHWRVLLSHLVLFPYVYPNEPAPQQVIDALLDRAKSEPKADEGIRLCRGPLLSRAQYLVDVERWNYVDAREVPLGTMTPEEIDIWTKAIETKK